MNIIDSLLHQNARRLQRPSWLVTCSLRRREPFGTVSSQALYELAASNEEEARDSVRAHVRQAHPRSSIVSMSVARQVCPEGA